MRNFLTVCLFLCLTGRDVTGEEFENDIHYEEEETGGRLRLQSKGKLATIVDLDQINSVKRVLCRHNLILVALKKDEPDVNWKKGQIIIGSGAWGCSHNVLKPESRTIYAKIAEIKRPKERVVEIRTEDAGPLDIFERADITVHYEQGPLTPHRHRRYISNPLHTALNRVNYSASFTQNIPFNTNGQDMADRVVNVFKRSGPLDPEVDTEPETNYTDKDFLFRCFNCHGYSHISYHFELVVYKVDNKAVVKKYVMDMDINSRLQYNYSIYTDKEISLTKWGTVWKTPPTEIFQTPLAVFKTFPPIMLTVNYSGQANIMLKSVNQNVTSYTGDFDVTGRTVISQKFEEGKPTVNDVSVYNWTSTSSNQAVDTNHTMNTSYAFFQNVTISPSVSWAQKDVDMNLGPPIHISLRPTLNAVSTTDAIKRCNKVKVDVDSNVTVAETDFSVIAFGIKIWDVKIMNSLSRKLKVQHSELSEHCHADCHAPFELNNEIPMETACGQPSGRIVRGDSRFESLRQLWGNYVLFAAEEASSSSWCGSTGRPCVDCSDHSIGDDVNNACADRLMTSELAASVSRLAKLVNAEWPDRKIFVKEAFDEPTSDYPDGRHGNESVFYEGRGAEIAVTKDLQLGNIETETDQYVLNRLSELAVCSNFAYVKRVADDVNVCVKHKQLTDRSKRSVLSRTRRSGHVEHHMVEDLLTKLGEKVRAKRHTFTDPAPLTLGTSYPTGETMDTACGAFTGRVSHDDTARMGRLVEYPLPNVEFKPEGSNDTWCGVETRRCQDCNQASGDIDDQWTWCDTRTMHMRLATRLQRLANIIDDTVVVEKALSMDHSDGSSLLYEEGRAARLSLKPGSSLTMSAFTSKVILAGFDFVRYTSSSTLEVCVKVQDGIQTHLAQFPLSNLISVPLPLAQEDEYDYPDELKHEARKPMLFDVSTSEDGIAEHFKLHNFISPGKRYIRLDTVLVTLLNLAYEDLKGGFSVIPGSGYRPRSVNIDNIATRHEKEKLRFEMGQAVEIKPNLAPTTDNLYKLALSLIRMGKGVRLQQIGIGIGCKADRLYFDIRPLQDVTSLVVETWDSGNTELYDRLKAVQDLIEAGGSVVTARSDPVICRRPDLGDQYFYFNFDLDQEGHCWADKTDNCAETLETRHNISIVLQRRLTSAAGTGKLPRPDIMPEIENCVVQTCGGCPSAGSIWKQKVLACTRMILKYLSRASIPFQPLADKVAIFNTERHESTVHGLACHEGRVCIENTQIYSLLLPLTTAMYKHDNADELVFGGADNPSPLLEIVEQELAWRAEGHVDVFIQNNTDVNALRNTIKILLMYNNKVSDVTFHLDPDADQDDVIVTLQGKVEQWVSSVCPSRSRHVTTPYTMVAISQARKRRSVERSADRNKMKLEMRNWEIDWMLKS